jgi:hypothetical protein
MTPAELLKVYNALDNSAKCSRSGSSSSTSKHQEQRPSYWIERTLRHRGATSHALAPGSRHVGHNVRKRSRLTVEVRPGALAVQGLLQESPPHTMKGA